MQLFGFPAAVFFIVSNEFCERFSYYGMKAILILYLTMYCKLEQNDAISIAHGFNMVCYLMPLAGAILADSYIGKYKTIVYISMIYSVGNAVMAVTALPAVGQGQMWGPALGLLLIGVGTGGIKPCVAAFGGDQFSENEEGKLGSFFSLFYFSINAGSVLSMLITPFLRVVSCMGEETCYSLAFGVPAILMVVAICIFLVGDCITKYVKRTPEGNIFGDVCRCIFHALRRRSKLKSEDSRAHWLDYADDKYPRQLISDIKAVLNVLTIFLPLIMFWALFEQQATRWTLQAQRLDGMGFLLPDQMGVLNALLILVFIPIFDRGVYPLLNKCGFAMRPLQRIGVGLLLTSASFVVSGFLEVALENQDLHPPPSGFGYVTVINNLDTKIQVLPQTEGIFPSKDYSVLPKSIMDAARVKIRKEGVQEILGDKRGNFTWEPTEIRITCDTCKSNPAPLNTSLSVENTKGLICVVVEKGGKLNYTEVEEEIEKPKDGKVWIRFVTMEDQLKGVQIQIHSDYRNKITNVTLGETVEVDYGYHYFKKMGEEPEKKKIDKTYFGVGGAYTVVLKLANSKLDYDRYTNTQANQYSMLWQIPQYVIITMGEIMVSVTGLSFAYSQAPDSMKAVLQSGWLFTTFCGNAVVVIVTEAQHGSDSKLSHSAELFLFAGLCLICTFLFAFLATSYRYVNVSDSSSDPGSASKVNPELELDVIPNGKPAIANGKNNVAYEDDH